MKAKLIYRYSNGNMSNEQGSIKTLDGEVIIEFMKFRASEHGVSLEDALTIAKDKGFNTFVCSYKYFRESFMKKHDIKRIKDECRR